VKVEPLPFIYNYPIESIRSYTRSDGSLEDFFKYEQMPRLHQEINQLFSPLTPLNHSIFENGHPSKKKGSFFKRLPDVGENKLVLFVYHDPEAQGQQPTLELQLFDKKNRITDKMIVADAIIGEDCKWYRSFTYSKDTLLTLIDTDNCHNLDKGVKSFPRSVTFLYKIKHTGNIVRYFKNSNGEVAEALNDFGNEESKNKYISKGKVKGHLKQGLWEEFEPDMYNVNQTDKHVHLIKAIGYYKDGEKDGEWLYYKIDNTSEYPNLAQRYKAGKLVEQTTDLDSMDNYTLIKKLDSLIKK
jgi:hypothetical protein